MHLLIIPPQITFKNLFMKNNERYFYKYQLQFYHQTKKDVQFYKGATDFNNDWH